MQSAADGRGCAPRLLSNRVESSAVGTCSRELRDALGVQLLHLHRRPLPCFAARLAPPAYNKPTAAPAPARAPLHSIAPIAYRLTSHPSAVYTLFPTRVELPSRAQLHSPQLCARAATEPIVAMAGQQQQIIDTIFSMKRKMLRRDDCQDPPAPLATRADPRSG
jgi:hypothetical protein